MELRLGPKVQNHAERDGGVEEGTGAGLDVRVPGRHRGSDVFRSVAAPQARHQGTERGDAITRTA